MESLSRRMCAALVVAVAGPGTAVLTLQLVVPLGLALTPATDGGPVAEFLSAMVGLVIAALVSTFAACVAFAATTLVVLRLTRCPRAETAWLTCLGLSALWWVALPPVESGLDPRLALGVLAAMLAAVRFGFGHRPQTSTGT